MDIKLTPQMKKILKAIFSAFSLLLLIFILIKSSIVLMPFLIALLIANFLEPVAKFFRQKLKFNKKIASLTTLLLFLSTIGITIFFAISKLIGEITDLSKNLNKIYLNHEKDLVIQFKELQNFYEALPTQYRETIETNLSKLSGYLVNFAETILNGLLSFANSIPGFFVGIVVIILAIYFFLSDKDKIVNFVNTQVPKKWIDKTKYLVDNIFVALLKYLQAQLILITIAFIILLIGFLILDIKYALLIAFLTCLVDALPVLGIGSVLIPWAIFQFIFASPQTAIGLLILYVIVVVVRQVTEPKIYGTQMGVHPLIAIIAMYVGFNYFGILGLILSPIIVMVAKNILDESIKSHLLIELFDPDANKKSTGENDNNSSKNNTHNDTEIKNTDKEKINKSTKNVKPNNKVNKNKSKNK
jgi:sporulation integral membrane protein YtvI